MPDNNENVIFEFEPIHIKGTAAILSTDDFEKLVGYLSELVTERYY